MSVMDSLKAETLLEGSFVLTQIETLKKALQYKTDAQFVSYEDHFAYLQKGIDEIKQIKLLDVVPARGGAKYESDLLSVLEEIQDQCERWAVKTIRFQGDLVRAMSDVNETKAAFESWYYLAAIDVLAKSGIKLPTQNIKNLATSEFNRLMDRSNMALDAFIEALKIEVKRIDNRRKMAKMKFDMGREQVNAAWANVLPETLGVSPAPRLPVTLNPNDYDDDDEMPPAYVSREGKLRLAAPSAQEEMSAEDTAKADAECSLTPLDTYCGVCLEPQYGCPSGTTCVNYHGGAPELTLEERNSQAESRSMEQVRASMKEPVVEPVAEISNEFSGTIFKQGTPAPVTVLEEEAMPDNYWIDQTPAYDDAEESQIVEEPQAEIVEPLPDDYESPAEIVEPLPEDESPIAVVETVIVEVESEGGSKVTEIHLPEKEAAPAPVSKRRVMEFDDIDDDDFPSPVQEKKSEPAPAEPDPEPVVVAAQPEVVDTKPASPEPSTKATPVSTRKPMKFEFDDDDF